MRKITPKVFSVAADILFETEHSSCCAAIDRVYHECPQVYGGDELAWEMDGDYLLFYKMHKPRKPDPCYIGWFGSVYVEKNKILREQLLREVEINIRAQFGNAEVYID